MYVKVFGSILHSSVWAGTSPELKVVWITLLVLADADGYVDASVPGVAHAAGITVEACEKALGTLAAPDPYSKSDEHEGRRVEAVEGGFWLLNYARYRETQTKEQRQAAARQRRKYVRDREPSRTSRTEEEAEAEAEAEAEQETGKRKASRVREHSRSVPHETWLTPFWDVWVAQFGGKPNAGPLAKELKPLVDEHGEAEVLKRWRRYLKQSDGKASAFHFQSQWKRWGRMTDDELRILEADI